MEHIERIKSIIDKVHFSNNKDRNVIDFDYNRFVKATQIFLYDQLKELPYSKFPKINIIIDLDFDTVN